jgi:hypothetical protein
MNALINLSVCQLKSPDHCSSHAASSLVPSATLATVSHSGPTPLFCYTGNTSLNIVPLEGNITCSRSRMRQLMPPHP